MAVAGDRRRMGGAGGGASVFRALWQRILGRKSSEVQRPEPRSTPHALVPSTTIARHFVEPPGARSGVCPNCQCALAVQPVRTRKCPQCRAIIVVRTNRADGAKLLLTEGQAADYDKVRREEARMNAAMRRAANIGIERSEFERRFREMAARAGSPPSPREVFWALAEEAVGAARRREDWWDVSRARWEQARLLCEEGADCMPLMREASKFQLLSLQQQGIKTVTLLSSQDDRVCDGCRAHDGRRMSISSTVGGKPGLKHRNLVSGKEGRVDMGNPG